ncbi:cytochrome P450 [Mycena galopus ATCC 62051]|nr:cytochrome P450 [Mycena galopus ATCC 62051]
MALYDFLPGVVLSSILLAIVGLLRRWKTTSRLPFPPGPKPRFITGNFFDIPTELSWITYAEWGKQYGDVVHVEVFGNHILILNSTKAAMELLEKRAAIYSDRPTIPMVPLLGWGFSFGFMPHTENWREVDGRRKLFQQHFRRDAITAQRPVQLKKVQDLLRSLLSSPEDFAAHSKTQIFRPSYRNNANDFNRLAAAIIMATIYGYDIKSMHDRFVYLAEEGVKRLCESVFPGAFAVNTFPFLRYLPSWFPGCGFHRYAQVSGGFPNSFQRDGVGEFSVVRELLEKNDMHGDSLEREELIKDVVAVAYAAAVDTTMATLIVFFMAMALNPEVVRKAQNEIDAVVGVGSLPGFEHRSGLPYCEAVVREVLRWRPIVPLAIAHATSEDDIYEGYFIPKGTMVLPNVWAMVHDESVYPVPDKFNPERFLNPDGQLSTDDHILSFGFGRRKCAGRHAADATVWATIVSVLSTFNIAKAKNEAGKEIEIEPVFTDGLVR